MPRTYCEESSVLYWEVYNEMNGIKQKKKDSGIKKIEFNTILKIRNIIVK